MIKQILQPREVPLIGGMSVRRILPLRGGGLVGPFAFLDEMGPMTLAPGDVGDVPRHPHIGLETVTYLFEGEIHHRDSLGSVQAIQPGDVNWMTAGRGITHSERIPPELRREGRRLFGLQAWVALPVAEEECPPEFVHYPARDLPQFDLDGVDISLIAGSAFGKISPVKTRSKLFYLAARWKKDQTLSLDTAGQESALYLISGQVEINGQPIPGPALVVFETGAHVSVRGRAGSHAVWLGGETVPEHRHIYWNFVASTRERIERAKAEWRAQQFATIPGETEWVPLPEDKR